MIYKISPHTLVFIDNQVLIGRNIILKQGAFVEGEVIKILKDNKLLIKIQNKEIIAETNLLRFKPGEKVNFWIKKVHPQIVLQTMSKKVNKLDKFINYLIKEFGEKGVKNLAFNPLTKNVEKEFEKNIKEKKIITKIIKLIKENKKEVRELIELIKQFDDDEYLLPLWIENKIYIARFKAEQSEEKNLINIYFSIETENMGTIEVEINQINQKIRINIFVENNKIAEYIQSYVPILKKIIDNKINFIAVKTKEKEFFHKEIEMIV